MRLSSVIFRVDLEIALRVLANGANIGRVGANDKVSAISALPNLNSGFFEDFLRLDVL